MSPAARANARSSRSSADSVLGVAISQKSTALSLATLGVVMVTINQSILLISLPDMFRGIHLNPLAPANVSYFLWVLMGFLLVTAVLVVSLGRVGDIYGRARMFNLGFAVFTFFSILLSCTFITGVPGVLWIILLRVFQGVGGALLFANSSAIITDAFPPSERGWAMGINGVGAVSGSFLGLILGGVLAPIEWRLVFVVSVPFGLVGTVWGYRRLRDTGVRVAAKIDWIGNATFAVGLVALLIGIVYSLLPHGGHPTGWTNPWVLAGVFGGIAVLGLFVWIETKVPAPMFHLELFRIRAFVMGNVAALMAALGRGGLQFMLVIWLQGIWLPQHGYSFAKTPLWAGIYMIPLTLGFFLGPFSGGLSDRYGSRLLTSLGLGLSGSAFLLLELLPMNFNYVWFALLLFLFGMGMGLFFSPNLSAIMNSLPPDQRGARGRHDHDVLQLGHRVVLRPLLHHRDPRIGCRATVPPVQRADGCRHPTGRGPPCGQRAAHRQPLLGVPRLQPHPRVARPNRSAAAPLGPPGRLRDEPVVLSEAHRATVRPRAAPGLRPRGGGGGDRRCRLCPDGPALRPLRAAGVRADRRRRRGYRPSLTIVISVFHLAGVYGLAFEPWQIRRPMSTFPARLATP